MPKQKNLLLFLFFTAFLGASFLHAAPSNKLNVLLWSGTVDPKLIKKFEQETGITVTLNLMDSDETIEAKLLTGEAGFDVISPTLSPFYIRQMKLGLFHPLTERDIPNLKKVSPKIRSLLLKLSGGTQHGAPISWGVAGLAVHTKNLKEALGEDAPLHSWELLYTPLYAEKLKKCGILMLDDPLEVFLSLYFAQKKKFDIRSAEGLKPLTDSLKKIIPFIKKFDSASDSIITQLVEGKACLVHCFSGEARKAIQLLKSKKEVGAIQFIRPKEGHSIFMDMLVIPKTAKNIENAYKFINFLLDEKNAAANFLFSLQSSAIEGYQKHLPKEHAPLTEDFPSELGKEVFELEEALTFRQTKQLSNAWLRARLNL